MTQNQAVVCYVEYIQSNSKTRITGTNLDNHKRVPPGFSHEGQIYFVTFSLWGPQVVYSLALLYPVPIYDLGI